MHGRGEDEDLDTTTQIPHTNMLRAPEAASSRMHYSRLLYHCQNIMRQQCLSIFGGVIPIVQVYSSIYPSISRIWIVCQRVTNYLTECISKKDTGIVRRALRGFTINRSGAQIIGPRRLDFYFGISRLFLEKFHTAHSWIWIGDPVGISESPS